MQKKIICAVTVAQSVGFFSSMILDLREKGYEVISISSPGSQLKALKDKGIQVIEVPMERHISIVKDMKSLLSLIYIFYKENPYMVHSMTPKAGMLCMLAAWLTRIHIRVHTFTGLVWPTKFGIKRKVLMFTDWLTCACATHIIPEGKGVMDDLQAHITKKPMKVLGYGNVKGVDMERFSLRPEVVEASKLLKDDSKFTFVFVGRIVGDKGMNELMEAFERLSAEKQNARLFIVGGYEEHLDPVKPVTLERIKNNSNIEAVGPKYGDDLIVYYVSSNCFVFPSYREGFPNTVMEAGAMGLPSIVTDINGSREIIENGKNGVIIPSKDADALFEAMKKMMEDKDAYKHMIENARPMIENRFEQNFIKNCLLDFYGEIIK